MDFQQTSLAICAAAIVYISYRRYRNPTIRDVPGPKSPSWIYGHQWYWQYEGVGVLEKRILEEYGNVARWNGPLGEDRLWIADPKAVHHVIQGSSHMYKKPSSERGRFALVMDRGLVWAEGDVHKRQRRAMAPAFGLVEAKGLFPYFVQCSNSLVDKWHEVISNGEPGQAVVMNVCSWLSKATLDAIGAGAFEYDFGALENTDNNFTKSYSNMIFGAFGMPSKERVLMTNVLGWASESFISWMFERDQRPGMVNLRKNREYAHEVAAKLIEEKRQELKDGTSRKDLLSLLVKASSALRPEWRLNEEMIAQVRTIMFAGHETTGKTLAFCLWELAKKRDVQERLRAEITETLEKIRARGDSGFDVNDFDSMPYLVAVGKEALRLHPAATDIKRVAAEDDVLPLTTPVVGVSGKVYNELPVPAGTYVSVSSVGYNLSKELWGPDADEFRPERWLDMSEKPETPLGVYGNLITFSGGPRSCIGWRFAVVEMHTFLVALIKQYDFSLPDNEPEIKMLRPSSALPVVVGEEHKGSQLPLKVTALT